MDGPFSRVCVLIFLILFGAPLTTHAERLSVESFSNLPQFENPKLSPGGLRIAFLENADIDDGVTLLSTVDLQTGEQTYLLQSDNEKVKINWYRWVNDKTLAISARYESRERNVKYYQTRLYAMDYNDSGEKARLLIKPRGASQDRANLSQFQDNVIDWLPNDPEHIMVAIDLDRALLPSVYRLNVYTTRLSRIEKGKRKIRDWLTDKQGNLRVGVTLDYEDGEREILVRRKPDSDDWDSIFSYNTMTESGIYPVGFGLDPNLLYYKAYHNDKLALFTWNLTDDSKTQVFADPDYDVSGGLIYSPKTQDAIGVYHANSELGRIYWDERFVALHKGFDQAFPDTDNYLISLDQQENSYILYSENDYTPGSYYIGNRENRSLGLLFDTYPSLMQTDVLTQHQKVTYTARDGTVIEGYLTLPKNKGEGPVPTILHPHGGPGARDFGGFDYWTSFLSNRGYAVFRPNFRGSTGYGYEFARSQMQSWGMAMQDDLTDATHWLIEQGIADPEKVCIVGASYGGYAALMATVKTPDLFACSVSFAGVSNLRQLVSSSRRFVNKEFVKNQIGSDSDDLEARSPYYAVERIKTPILLVHGDEDRVVDVRQSRMMADELEDHDKDFEYIELESGDHYLSIQRNRHRFFTAVDEFLTQHLDE